MVFAQGGRGSVARPFRIAGCVGRKSGLLAWVLDRTAKGIDFADSLHLGTAAHREMMFTFDRRFIRDAVDAPVSVIEP